MGITGDTPYPKGGRVRREADGKTPNGVLEELASIPYFVTILKHETQEDKDDLQGCARWKPAAHEFLEFCRLCRIALPGLTSESNVVPT